MKRVFVAGATSPLGGSLCAEYQRRGWYVMAHVTTSNQIEPIAADQLIAAKATDATSLNGIMAGADLVVSCLDAMRQTDGLNNSDANYRANLNLLREAERAGASRFVYVHVVTAKDFGHIPLGVEKSKFLAALQSSAIAATAITSCDSRKDALFRLDAFGLDIADAEDVTRHVMDRPKANFAPTKTSRIHHMTPERTLS